MGKFNPNGIAPIIANGSIRALVQTVLPTVYDDSLSYFEVLGKVIKAVNTDTENVNTLAENQTKFFNDLTDFVNENVYAEVYTVDWNGSSQLSNEVGAKLEEFITNNGIARVHFTGDNPYYAYLYNTVNVSDNPINKRYWFASILMTDIDKASIKTVRVEHTQTGFYIRSDTINFASEGYVNSSVLNAITYIEGKINANSVVRVEFHVTKENGVYTYKSANKTPEELKTLMGINDGKTPIEYYAIVDDKDISIPSTPPETGGDWNDPTEIYMRPRVSRSKTYVNDVYYDIILVSFTISDDKHNKEILQFSNEDDTAWSFYHGFIERYITLSINARDTNGVISNIYSPKNVEGWYNAISEVTSKRSPIVAELTLVYGDPSSTYISADIRTSEIYAAHTSTVKTVVVKFRAEGKTYTFTGNAINNTWEAVTSDGAVEIDNTLSVAGAAADAKVTGDEIGDLKRAIDLETVNASTNLIDNRGMPGKTPAELFGLASENYAAYIPLVWGPDTTEGSFRGYFVLNDGASDKSSLNAIQLTLCDENKTDISGNFTQQNFNAYTLNIPRTAKYIKLTMYNWYNYSIVKFGICKSEYSIYTEETVSARLNNIETNAWSGKKWVSYGDSITQLGTYQPFVASKIGLTVVNAGLGGSAVADGTDISVASFTDSNRISALPVDADVVTIMGGTNDFNMTNSGAGSPLGSLPTSETFDTTTFIGALCQTVKLIQTQCPNALIIICGNIGGRGNTGRVDGYQLANSLGLTCVDYAKAAKSVAEYMGIPYIPTDECGINPFNRVSYITDTVHPNTVGAELISRPIIAYFETNQPN